MRHEGPAAIAVALVLLGSALQIVVARRMPAGSGRAQPPTSATVVNVVTPIGVLLVAASTAYLRLTGGTHTHGNKLIVTLVAAALVVSAIYTGVVALFAFAVAVVSHGLRRVWPSVWVVTAASVTCLALLPIAQR
jgi:hypothetical protein